MKLLNTAPADGIYRVGTLAYTRAALVQVMFWMLLGDFALTVMESAVPAILPLQLRAAGANDFSVAFIAISIPAILTVLCAPIIGMQSDRLRTKMGRRRPFILWFSPCVVISLLMLGCAEPFAQWLYDVFFLERFGYITQGGVLTALLGFFGASYTLFNIYILSNYQFLIKDVIPAEVLGRFIGFYRALGAIGGFVFNRYVFGFVETDTFTVYLICAVLYAVGFGLLFWQVREGSYPPPPPASPKTLSGRLTGAKDYFVRCFSRGFYLKIYAQSFCYWAAWVPFMTFIVFFATAATKPDYAQTLGLSLEDFGRIKGWTLLVQIPIFFVAGWLCDRFHPLRVQLGGSLLVGVTYLSGFVFVRDNTSFLLWWICNSAACGVFMAAYLTTFARLLPSERYGEFMSANTIVFHFGLILSPMLSGYLLGIVKDYRFMFIWAGCIALVGTVILLFLYREWLKLGGDERYSPPGEQVVDICSDDNFSREGDAK